MNAQKRKQQHGVVVVVAAPWWREVDASTAIVHAKQLSSQKKRHSKHSKQHTTTVLCTPSLCEGSAVERTLRLHLPLPLRVTYLATPEPSLHASAASFYLEEALQALSPILHDVKGFIADSLLLHSFGASTEWDGYYHSQKRFQVIPIDAEKSVSPKILQENQAGFAEYCSVLGTLGGRFKEGLPVAKELGRIARLAGENPMVAVSAGTGSGKSTLVPLALLRWAQIHGKNHIKIAVALPRRAAVSGVHRIVSSIYGSNLVGYKMGGKSHNLSAPIIYVTTGSLLRELVAPLELEEEVEKESERKMNSSVLEQFVKVLGCESKQVSLREPGKYSHIILDECHLSNVETELVKGILLRHTEGVVDIGVPSVLFMTATLTTQLRTAVSAVGPIIEIESTPFTVTELLLDDITKTLELISGDHECYELLRRLHPVVFGKERRGGTDGVGGSETEGVQKNVVVVVPPPLLRLPILEAFLAALLCGAAAPGSINAVLVFLPGMQWIRQVESSLLRLEKGRSEVKNSREIQIICVHSELDGAAMLKNASKKNTILAILATNAVELGVTLPDVDVVVDCCLERRRGGVDDTLITQLCSQSSVRQRAGRVGRCRPGWAYRMLTSSELNSLPEASSDLATLPTESAVLSATLFASRHGGGDVTSGLLNLISSEGEPAFNQATQRLLRYGVLRTSRGAHRATPLAALFHSLPLDPSLAYMVLLCSRSGMFSVGCEVAAIISAKVFKSVVSHRCAVLYPPKGIESDNWERQSAWRMGNGSHSEVIAGVNLMRLYRARRCEMAAEGVEEGCGEGVEGGEGGCQVCSAMRYAAVQLRDICNAFADSAVCCAEYTAASAPMTHKEMLQLSVLWCVAFPQQMEVYRAKDTTTRGDAIPSHFIRRHTITINPKRTSVHSLSSISGLKKELHDVVGCSVAAVHPPRSSELRSAREVHVQFTVAKGGAACPLWGVPFSVWRAERSGIGRGQNQGSLRRIFKSSTAQHTRGGFAPPLLPHDIEPSFWPTHLATLKEPPIICSSTHGAMVLPASVPALFSCLILISQDLMDKRTEETVSAVSALENGGLVSVQGHPNIAVDCGKLVDILGGGVVRLVGAAREALVGDGGEGGGGGGALGALLQLLVDAGKRPDGALPGLSGNAGNAFVFDDTVAAAFYDLSESTAVEEDSCEDYFD